ncbi:MAG: heavy metal translocating P-type ATPase [Eubacteriales bacterium]
MKRLLTYEKELRMALSAVLLLVALLLGPGIAALSVSAAALLLVGVPVMAEAARGLLRGGLLDETFLMSLAALGAFVIGEYTEGVAVMLFYSVGEYFEGRAVSTSKRIIRSLMDINPDTACLLRDGAELRIPAAEVAVGDVLLIRAGERVPVDSVVLSGEAAVDTSALTGEALPLAAQAGTELSSGMLCIDGVLRVRAVRICEESAAARILALVSEAQSRKSRQENFITRFAQWYTPAVVAAALLVALLPPLFFGQGWLDWLYKALAFLVVSCPCALLISVPLSFFGGIAGAASRGILFKGGNSFEAMAKAETVVFDKTGTLTEGRFTVAKVSPVQGMSEAELLTLAATAEHGSTHPLARAIYQSVTSPPPPPDSVSEYAGKGVIATLGEVQIAVGSRALLSIVGADSGPLPEGSVGVARNGVFVGTIDLSDTTRPGVRQAIARLRALGVKRTAMLTGDSLGRAQTVADEAGIDFVKAGLLPQDKYAALEALMSDGTGSVVYVGDGINDAPVLARADVGVAMGGIGSDAAIEAADVVLMHDAPDKLVQARLISRRTLSIARQNIIFALGVKVGVMAVVTAGWAGLWWAVFADVGVALLAILNAMRAIFPPRKKEDR